MLETDALFDGDFLKKLEYLHILSKRVFSGQFRAERRARQRGSGLEFADHRAYAPGDDFRHVDWGAYQRLDRLLLRLFEEEQDLPIYLFLDCSRSMAAGRPTKFHYGCHIAAALCYIGLSHLDRVTLLAYASHIIREAPPLRGKGRILRIFDFLREIEPVGTTDARTAFSSFCARHLTRGVAVVISDFFDPAGLAPGLDTLRYAHHDIVAVHIVDEADANPAVRGDIQLVDVETGGMRTVNVNPAILAAYREAFDAFGRELEGYCFRNGLAYLRTDTALPFEDAILRVFRQGRFLA